MDKKKEWTKQKLQNSLTSAVCKSFAKWNEIYYDFFRNVIRKRILIEHVSDYMECFYIHAIS